MEAIQCQVKRREGGLWHGSGCENFGGGGIGEEKRLVHSMVIFIYFCFVAFSVFSLFSVNNVGNSTLT